MIGNGTARANAHRAPPRPRRRRRTPSAPTTPRPLRYRPSNHHRRPQQELERRAATTRCGPPRHKTLRRSRPEQAHRCPCTLMDRRRRLSCCCRHERLNSPFITMIMPDRAGIAPTPGQHDPQTHEKSRAAAMNVSLNHEAISLETTLTRDRMAGVRRLLSTERQTVRRYAAMARIFGETTR